MTSNKGRTLCTEDDADTRDLIILTLGRAGYEVKCTDNAEETLNLTIKEEFGRCLLDYWLPEPSGVDLCRNIREFDPRTPILFYSAAAYAADKERAFPLAHKAT